MQTKKKILITGSGGMLGKDVALAFDDGQYAIFGVDRVLNPSSAETVIGDITDKVFLDDLLNKILPDIIIHCAALVNVDLCENNKEAAHNLHVEASKHLASFDKAKIVYISTDSVFDGQKGNYDENSIPNPLNYYAKSKLEGEQAVLSANKKAIVARTNIYGFRRPLGKSLAEWAISEFEGNHKVSGFSDVYFNPLYTKQLARAIKRLVEIDYSGIINVASTNIVSKYDFLVSLSKSLGYPDGLVDKGTINQSALTAKRPRNSTLNVDKLTEIYDSNLLSFRSGISEISDDYLNP